MRAIARLAERRPGAGGGQGPRVLGADVHREARGGDVGPGLQVEPQAGHEQAGRLAGQNQGVTSPHCPTSMRFAVLN